MLKKVKVEVALYIVASGNVALSAAQAKTRAHNLKAVVVGHDGAGEYEVRSPIQFKRGEEFGFSGKVGKDGVLSGLDPEDGRLAGSEPPPHAKVAKKMVDGVKGLFQGR